MPTFSFSLSNFKSYETEATLPLSTLTLLIGANASGKSNALEGLRILGWLAAGKNTEDVEKILQGDSLLVRGQSSDLFHQPEQPLFLRFQHLWEDTSVDNEPSLMVNFVLRLKLRGEKLEIEREEVFHQSPDHATKVDYYQRQADGIIDISLPRTNPPTLSPAFFAPLPPSQLFLPLALSRWDKGIPLPAGILFLKHALEHVFFLKCQPDLMRNYVNSSLTALREDGSNISATLYALCQDQQLRDTLLDCIRSLPEQNIRDIRFIKTERNDVMVRLEEEFRGNTRLIDAPLLSDGTLRVLAVAATLLSVPKNSLVVMEEIDNGVHPGRAGILMTSIHAIAQKRGLSVLLTAHNPALLDALPDESLPDVVCCYRDPEDGASRLVRLGDLDRYPALIARGSLGSLMTSRVLERFVKDGRSPAERKQAAIAWLDQLERDGGQ